MQEIQKQVEGLIAKRIKSNMPLYLNKEVFRMYHLSFRTLLEGVQTKVVL